ncbi:hypothetical protein DVH05_028246 [Phytophthora capsici]|nr:hypothetical protein DVH05_028246 [Phytophthora capsici]
MLHGRRLVQLGLGRQQERLVLHRRRSLQLGHGQQLERLVLQHRRQDLMLRGRVSAVTPDVARSYWNGVSYGVRQTEGENEESRN